MIFQQSGEMLSFYSHEAGGLFFKIRWNGSANPLDLVFIQPNSAQMRLAYFAAARFVIILD